MRLGKENNMNCPRLGFLSNVFVVVAFVGIVMLTAPSAQAQYWDVSSDYNCIDTDHYSSSWSSVCTGVGFNYAHSVYANPSAIANAYCGNVPLYGGTYVYATSGDPNVVAEAWVASIEATYQHHIRWAYDGDYEESGMAQSDGSCGDAGVF
jgi:hypothetical protein